MDLQSLYKKKMKILEEVLRITSNFKYTDNMESNINNYNALYDKREKYFSYLKDIDKEIKSTYPGKPFVDKNIKIISKKIVDLDKKLATKQPEMKSFVSSKIKDAKNGKKVQAYEVSNFDNLHELQVSFDSSC